MRRSMVRRMRRAPRVPCFFLRVARGRDGSSSRAPAACATRTVPTRPSVNDFIVRAVADRAPPHPVVNSSYVDGVVETYPRVNVGVAVAIEGGLVVPAVYAADRKDVHAISAAVREVADLAARGASSSPRAARATPPSRSRTSACTAWRTSTPIINPPQAAILGVGAAADEGGACACASRSAATTAC